jgi:hypothetical protein
MPTALPDDRAAKLFDEAATAGLRITGLDGWNQTRLAGSLKIRREVVNAIINRDPAAEPSGARPRMVEACRKIIAFAAIISRKDDAVVTREVEALGRLDDDAQAYEYDKLRLRKIVEDAVGGGAFIEAMYRVAELSSHAVHAPPRFRVKMIGNVVTTIQRLLDKPGSRSIPLDVLDHNLRRLTTVEWSARRAVHAMAPGDERVKSADDLAYIRGQVGYAMVFNGLLARSRKAIRRGRRRLCRAVRVQPSPDCGHWSNLLRATSDLMANRYRPARKWALAAVRIAEKQNHPGFAAAFTRLRDNGELTTLIDFWKKKGVTDRVNAVLARAQLAPAAAQAAARSRRARGPTAAAIVLLVGLLTAMTSSARAGDGKELSASRSAPQQRVPATGGAVQRVAAGPAFPAAAGPAGSAARTPRVGTFSAPPAAPSFYPPRTPRPTELSDALAEARAGAGGGAEVGGRAPSSPLARARALRDALAAATDTPTEFEADELDSRRPSGAAPPRLLDNEEETPVKSPRLAARPAPARPRNRLYPLIVVPPKPSALSYRTTPRQGVEKPQTTKAEVD